MSSNQPTATRTLLTTIAILVGVIAGLIAGILQSRNHASLPSVIEYGCGAFASGVVFTFCVINFWNGQQNRDS